MFKQLELLFLILTFVIGYGVLEPMLQIQHELLLLIK